MNVAGILLTGGGSRRMGVDKATLRAEATGETLARHIGRLLAAVASPCLEVGPGHSGLVAIEEPAGGDGPLVALTRGWEALMDDNLGPVLVVATDLPLLTATALRWLARYPDSVSVVPVVEGRPQPLCARWSGPDLRQARDLVAHGHRALRDLTTRCQPRLVDPTQPGGPGLGPFTDVDTPESARALGLVVP